ncbi:MAG: hypothetical protein P8Y72_03480 [Anaerolineales bacterium]
MRLPCASLDGTETFTIEGMSNQMSPNAKLTVTAVKADVSATNFTVETRLDTPMDVQIYRNGGILHKVLRERLAQS